MKSVENTSFIAMTYYIEQACSDDLVRIKEEFDAFEKGLGDKAVKLIVSIGASFGVKPGQVNPTAEILASMVKSRVIKYDRKLKLFFIKQRKDKYYLDPYVDNALTVEIFKLAKKLHQKFSAESKKSVNVSSPLLRHALSSVCNWVLYELQRERD